MKSDKLLLADIFKNFRNICVKVHELDPAYFLTVPGLAWQACLKKTDVKLELLTNFNMSLMAEEGIRGGMCYAVHRYAKANNKYMKNYDKNEESSILKYLDANNLHGWAMEQNLPVGGFKWVKDIFRVDEDFIKNYDENSGIRYFLKVHIEYPKKLHDLHSDLQFLPERMKMLFT